MEYVPDVHIRRSFGIYYKLNKADYEHLSYVMRPQPRKIGSLGYYTRYKLRNACESPTRREQRVEDDNIQIAVIILGNSVQYDFNLFRLRKKDSSKSKEANDYYHKGTLDDHYWDYSTYRYFHK
jgi:hypothetical protein